ncbi:MAG: YeeE/YedE family protein [Dethiobacter sp.]|jgi:uncharacterized membrane protein YedE/YeeE|nr:MAG: YeeE/YedE family protein [Dethiobacter sp.]
MSNPKGQEFMKDSLPKTEFFPQKKSEHFSLQIRDGLLLLFVNFLFLYFLGRYYPGGVLPWVFGLLFGFVLQRSRFCFAASFRDIFLIGNTILTRAVILGLAVTSTGFLLLEYFTPGQELLFTMAKVRPVGLFTVIGALLFGFGMVIAGGCVSGMLMRMGEGYLMQWVCMLGFLVGSAFGAWQLGWWMERFVLKSPAVFLPHILGWSGAIILQLILLSTLFVLAFVYEKGWTSFYTMLKNPFAGKPPIKILEWLNSLKGKNFYMLMFKIPWPYYAGSIILAFLNFTLFAVWGAPWSITGGITYFAAWLSTLLGFSPEKWAFFQKVKLLEGNYVLFSQVQIEYFKFPLVYHFMAIIIGSLLASLLAGEFRLRKWRSGRFIVSALLGGFLMGYGSRLALGCNIGAFFSAIPSLSLHGWVFGFFTLAGSFLGGKVLLKYLIT